MTADRNVLAHQRHAEHRSIFSDALVFEVSVLRISKTIRQMDRFLLQAGTTDQRLSADGDRVLGRVLEKNILGIIGRR